MSGMCGSCDGWVALTKRGASHSIQVTVVRGYERLELLREFSIQYLFMHLFTVRGCGYGLDLKSWLISLTCTLHLLWPPRPYLLLNVALFGESEMGIKCCHKYPIRICSSPKFTWFSLNNLAIDVYGSPSISLQSLLVSTMKSFCQNLFSLVLGKKKGVCGMHRQPPTTLLVL